MKTLLLFLVAAFVAEQALAQGHHTTTVRGGYLGLMKSKKFPCSQPDPAKSTFAWAKTNVLLPTDTVPGSPGGATGNRCVDVCGLGYHLAAVSSTPLPTPPMGPAGPPPPPANTTPYLCRFNYTSTKTGANTILYGYYRTPDTPGTGNCSAYSRADGIVVQQSEDDVFDCGCCGTINREGRRWERGCPDVTALVDPTPSGPQCPTDKTWTAPAGLQICTVTDMDIKYWGTIDPTGDAAGLCYAAPPDAPAGSSDLLTDPFQRFCYKINAYSGPPKPDCKHKNP